MPELQEVEEPARLSLHRLHRLLHGGLRLLQRLEVALLDGGHGGLHVLEVPMDRGLPLLELPLLLLQEALRDALLLLRSFLRLSLERLDDLGVARLARLLLSIEDV